MTSNFEEEQVRESLVYLMDKYYPGWDQRVHEFKTFQEYQDWVHTCLDVIVILPDEPRSDH